MDCFCLGANCPECRPGSSCYEEKIEELSALVEKTVWGQIAITQAVFMCFTMLFGGIGDAFIILLCFFFYKIPILKLTFFNGALRDVTEINVVCSVFELLRNCCFQSDRSHTSLIAWRPHPINAHMTSRHSDVDRLDGMTSTLNFDPVFVLAGNILVIVTVLVVFSKPIDVTNLFIVSLAAADFLVSTFVSPFQVLSESLRAFERRSQSRVLGNSTYCRCTWLQTTTTGRSRKVSVDSSSILSTRLF